MRFRPLLPVDNSKNDKLTEIKTQTIAKPERSALVRETAFNLALLSARRLSLIVIFI